MARRPDGPLPQRPRAHVLEGESLRAFEGALPPSWIFRRESLDYGLDGSVEVVDPDGSVTGRRFYVQLKATDAVGTARALRARCAASTARYYGQLDRPVLVVRYVAAERALYARWFHDVQPPEPRERSRWRVVSVSTTGAIGNVDEARGQRRAPPLAGERAAPSTGTDTTASTEARAAAVPPDHGRRGDVHHPADGDPGADQAAVEPPITIRFTAQDRWALDMPERIAEALDGWRWIRASSLTSPAVLRLESDAEAVHGHALHAIGNALDELARATASPVTISDAPDARRNRGIVRVSSTGAEVVLPAGFRATLGWEADSLAVTSTAQVAANLLVLVGLALASAGHQAVARRLISVVVPRSTLPADPRAAALIGEMYCADGHGVELVELAVRLLTRTGRESHDAVTALFAAEALLRALWFSYPHRAVSGRAPVTAALDPLADAILSGPWPDDLASARATFVYNIGHFIGLTPGDAGAALRRYAAGARLDPAYRQRGYYWKEVAALLFNIRRYRWAAHAYARAIALDAADVDLHGRYADALAYARDFGAAQAAYDDYFARREADLATAEPGARSGAQDVPLLPDLPRYAAWMLKSVTLPFLAAAALPPNATAPPVHGGLPSPPMPADAEWDAELASADAALARDPLDTAAWFARGLACARLGRSDDAWAAFTIAACYAPADAEAWANAAYLTMTSTREEFLPLIVWAAHGLHGSVFLRLLDYQIGQNAPAQRTEIRAYVERLARAGPSSDDQREVRIAMPDGSVDVIALEPQVDG